MKVITLLTIYICPHFDFLLINIQITWLIKVMFMCLSDANALCCLNHSSVPGLLNITTIFVIDFPPFHNPEADIRQPWADKVTLLHSANMCFCIFC